MRRLRTSEKVKKSKRRKNDGTRKNRSRNRRNRNYYDEFDTTEPSYGTATAPSTNLNTAIELDPANWLDLYNNATLMTELDSLEKTVFNGFFEEESEKNAACTAFITEIESQIESAPKAEPELTVVKSVLTKLKNVGPTTWQKNRTGLIFLIVLGVIAIIGVVIFLFYRHSKGGKELSNQEAQQHDKDVIKQQHETIQTLVNENTVLVHNNSKLSNILASSQQQQTS